MDSKLGRHQSGGSPLERFTHHLTRALVLGIAACIARGDGALLERLPDTAGLPNEVLIQRRHRYRYDSVVRLPGTRLIEVGSQSGTTIEDMASTISSRTAAVFFPAHMNGADGTVPMDRVISLAH